MPDESQTFYADEFFLSDDDPGVEVAVTIRGRQVPIWIKRGLTLEAEMACEVAAMKTTIGTDGKVAREVDGAALVTEILYRQINEWPFTDRKTGKTLPITRENIRRMLGGAEELVTKIKDLKTEGEAALAPFVAPSDAD